MPLSWANNRTKYFSSTARQFYYRTPLPTRFPITRVMPRRALSISKQFNQAPTQGSVRQSAKLPNDARNPDCFYAWTAIVSDAYMNTSFIVNRTSVSVTIFILLCIAKHCYFLALYTHVLVKTGKNVWVRSQLYQARLMAKTLCTIALAKWAA